MILGSKRCPCSYYKERWRSGGMVPLILNLGTKLVWVVGFTLRQLYYCGKSPCYPLHIGLWGVGGRDGVDVFFQKRQIVSLLGITQRFLGRRTQLMYELIFQFQFWEDAGVWQWGNVLDFQRIFPPVFNTYTTNTEKHPCIRDPLLITKRLRHANIRTFIYTIHKQYFYSFYFSA